jgi:predicted nucleic acid-binding protein
LDTNVVLDWLVFDDPAAQTLAGALADGRLHWIATAEMLDELAQVLPRPALDRWRARAEQALPRARLAVRQVETPAPRRPEPPLLCADPDDQKFIDLALAWPARWLLTRDKALLRLARSAQRHGTLVCAPGQWTGGSST